MTPGGCNKVDILTFPIYVQVNVWSINQLYIVLLNSYSTLLNFSFFIFLFIFSIFIPHFLTISSYYLSYCSLSFIRLIQPSLPVNYITFLICVHFSRFIFLFFEMCFWLFFVFFGLKIWLLFYFLECIFACYYILSSRYRYFFSGVGVGLKLYLK